VKGVGKDVKDKKIICISGTFGLCKSNREDDED
jgi:hypothetical protein